jgi:carboxylesterase
LALFPDQDLFQPKKKFDIRTDSMHRPTWRERESADSLIIFIHGFMGSPNQFRDFMEAVYEHGCSACTILLPGHGGTGRDFGLCGLADWEDHLQGELDKHKSAYRNIFLVGHSMGGLLALNASLQEQNRIHGVILLSTPFELDLRLRSLLRKASLLFFSQGNPIKETYWQARGISSFVPRPSWLKPVHSFSQLMHKTTLNLPRVFVPVLAVHSRNDETVSIISADILHNGLSNTSKKQLILKKSWHTYYPPGERAQMHSALLEFIDNNENQK